MSKQFLASYNGTASMNILTEWQNIQYVNRTHCDCDTTGHNPVWML